MEVHDQSENSSDVVEEYQVEEVDSLMQGLEDSSTEDDDQSECSQIDGDDLKQGFEVSSAEEDNPSISRKKNILSAMGESGRSDDSDVEMDAESLDNEIYDDFRMLGMKPSIK